MSEISVHVNHHGLTHVYGASGPSMLVDTVMTMIANLPDEDSRDVARKKLLRRLQHPELGACPNPDDPAIHPKPGTNLAAHQYGPVCVCGSPRYGHDIDGQRDDCDGYVEAP